MEDRRTIKEMFHCKYIVSDKELYPLQKWYNALLDKRLYEITIEDILRMLRQKEFLDIAMTKTIEELQKDLFVGEIFEGELIEKVSEMEQRILKPYSNELKGILKNASDKSDEYEWLDDEEKADFKKAVDVITRKITE